MGLERTTMMASYPHVGTKDFYAADDVDALLARIRVAVAAERGATAGLCVLRDYPYGQADHLRRKWMDDFKRRTDKFMDNSDALDALLAEAG